MVGGPRGFSDFTHQQLAIGGLSPSPGRDAPQVAFAFARKSARWFVVGDFSAAAVTEEEVLNEPNHPGSLGAPCT